MPFQPKGDQAEWRMLYEHLRSMEVGDVVSYEAMSEVLGRDFDTEGAKRNPLERARRELEIEDSRTLAVVRGVGYRVVEAREHMDLARTHHKRSTRQVEKAQQKLESADVRSLTATDRRRLEEMVNTTGHLLAEQRRATRRLQRIERALGIPEENGEGDTE